MDEGGGRGRTEEGGLCIGPGLPGRAGMNPLLGTEDIDLTAEHPFWATIALLSLVPPKALARGPGEQGDRAQGKVRTFGRRTLSSNRRGDGGRGKGAWRRER